MKSLTARLPKIADWIALLLLLLFFGRLLVMSANSSPTVDEVLHVFHGATYWRVSPGEILHNITNNPPLVNAIIGIPVNLALFPRLPMEPGVWGTGNAAFASHVFMWETNPNGLQIIWVGRLAVMALSLFLAALIYCWGKELFHNKLAALLPLLIYTFEPNIIAHSALATIVLGTAFFMFLAAYLLWRYWKLVAISPDTNYSGWRRSVSWLLAAVAIGAAVGAKFSGLVIVPAAILMTVFLILTTKKSRSFQRRALFELAGMFLLAFLVFLLIYRTDLAMLQADFDWQRDHQLTGHPAFLLGKVSRQGWWYYFPIVFAIKTPIPVLLLIALASVVFLLRRRFEWPLLWVLLIVGGVFVASMTTHVNIGYRYILPVLPLLFLFVGLLGWPDYRSSSVIRGMFAIGLLGLIVASVAIHPYYLAFYNLMVGGPEYGWRVAADSNIDWGQDLGKLSEFLDTEGIDSIQGMWMSIVPPSVYGIDVTFLYNLDISPELNETYGFFYPKRPAPGVYVFSPSHLQGVFESDQNMFHWFLDRPPDKKIGFSLFVYHVEPEGPPAGVSLSGIGISHLSATDYEKAFVGNDVHPRWNDARSNVLWPGGSPEGKPVASWAAIGSGHWPSHPVLQSFYPSNKPDIVGAGRNLEGEILEYGLYHWETSPIQLALEKGSPERTTFTEFGWSSVPVVGSSEWDSKRQRLTSDAIFDNSLQLLGYDV